MTVDEARVAALSAAAAYYAHKETYNAVASKQVLPTAEKFEEWLMRDKS